MALNAFCGSLRESDPQKVALQKDLQLLEGSCSDGGAKSLLALFHMVGRGIRSDHNFLSIGVKGISIPFAHKWLKSSVEKLSDNSFSHPRAPAFGGAKGGEMAPLGLFRAHLRVRHEARLELLDSFSTH
jgi:hypothetical protein